MSCQEDLRRTAATASGGATSEELHPNDHGLFASVSGTYAVLNPPSRSCEPKDSPSTAAAPSSAPTGHFAGSPQPATSSRTAPQHAEAAEQHATNGLSSTPSSRFAYPDTNAVSSPP